jgi:hypothetical protein
MTGDEYTVSHLDGEKPLKFHDTGGIAARIFEERMEHFPSATPTHQAVLGGLRRFENNFSNVFYRNTIGGVFRFYPV